jgi:hypothetical protein
MSELPGTALTDADLVSLRLSWIDSESAHRALLRRVTSLEGAELVGQRDGHDYAGIIFPNVFPGDSRPREFRLRRDSPEVTYENGVKKPQRKYLSPPGRSNLLYFVPATPGGLLVDVDLAVIITEGEKKGIALWRLAWHGLSDASDRPRFLPVALSGVWNWKGIVGKETGPKGQRVDVKGVIADFDRLVWIDRKVVIAFDSDVRTNDKVRAARLELARHLIHERGAQVHLLETPVNGAAEKIGIDDLLGQVGPEKVLKLVERAKKANLKQRATPILASMSEDVEFFHGPDMKPYATFLVNGHKETWPTRSHGFRNWLSIKFYHEQNKAPSTQAIQEALAVCDARAQFDGPACEVGVRMGGAGTDVYLDLCNDNWQAIAIQAPGWRVVPDPPVRFRRARGMTPLPIPVSGNICQLRQFINAGSDENWILMVAWLVGSLNPSGPYPILILQGEQGTGKSTVARALRSLVDPSTAPLRSIPREERDLMIAASNSWVISFDNLSGIQQWLSDALCRLSTGGGFATRELHTDNEEILFDATRPIILNGIDDIAASADLADRSIIVTLPQVPEEGRIPEKLFWKDFSREQPGIIGGLLDAVSAAVRNLDHVNIPRLPRMADFVRWICAAVPALPFSQEAFLWAYSNNRREFVLLSIESSPVATSIQSLVAASDWEGTATELLQTLNGTVREDIRKTKVWPKDARSISSKVRRLAPLLRQAGVHITFDTVGHQRTKLITLTKKLTQISDRSDRNQNSPFDTNDLPADSDASTQRWRSDRRDQSEAATKTNLRAQAAER